MGGKTEQPKGGSDGLEAATKALSVNRHLASLWNSIGLPEDQHQAFVTADPAVLPALTELAITDPTAERVTAIGLILRVPIHSPENREELTAALSELHEAVGREHSRAAILQTIVNLHPGTWVRKRIDTIFRARYLLVDAGNDLLRYLQRLEDPQVALAAMEEDKGDGSGPLLRELHLRLHSFVAASTTLGDYVANTGRLTNEQLADLGNQIRTKPLSAFLRELRNHALHEDTLPVKPSFRFGGLALTGSAVLYREQLLQLRSWTKNVDGRRYLDEAEGNVLHLDDLVHEHLHDVAESVKTFLDALFDARGALIAEAAHFRSRLTQENAATVRQVFSDPE